MPVVEVQVELALHLLETVFGSRFSTGRVIAFGGRGGRRSGRRRRRGVQNAFEVLVDVAVEVCADEVEPEDVETPHLGGDLVGYLARHVVYSYRIQFLY